jgi:tetratricopeptide (TPR) repeat protein
MRNSIFILLIGLLNWGISLAQPSDREKRMAKNSFNKAVDEIHLLNYEEALSILTYSMELDPDNLETQLTLAKVKIELGKDQSALSDIKSLAIDYPQNEEIWFYIAYLSFQGVADSSILDSYNKAISYGYNQMQAYYNRGIIFFLFDDYLNAISDFTKAIELDSKNSAAYHDRGSARKALGDIQGALHDYRMAAEYNHNFPIAFNNMGSTKIILGDYEGAIQDYSVAIKLDSSFYMAYNNRGAAYYYLGRINEAMLDFDKSISLKTKYIPAMNNQASVLSKLANNQEALILLNGIISISESNGVAYLNRGMVREMTGDIKGACEDWSKAFELGTQDAGTYLKECK